MSDKVISMKSKSQMKREKIQSETAENATNEEKIHENLKQLAAYRGDVLTKNNIRNLPDVKIGEIFWVSSDKKAYIVAKKEGNKLTIKALDETATISTGITIYEMNKSIVEKEPVFDMEDEAAYYDLESNILRWFTKVCPATYYLAYGKDLHYVTLFKKSSKYGFDEKSVKNFVDTLSAVGTLISMDFMEDRIEIWMRTKGSRAEMIYVMAYDNGLVRLS